MLRVGGVFLVQHNNRLDTGAARGKVTFETFEDLLVGLSSADNQSPVGRSNIETVEPTRAWGRRARCSISTGTITGRDSHRTISR